MLNKCGSSFKLCNGVEFNVEIVQLCDSERVAIFVIDIIMCPTLMLTNAAILLQ